MEEKIEKMSTTLNKQAKYSKNAKISKLPLYLNIQFVRFFWKQQTKVKAKILRKVEFPFILDVYDLCTDDLKTKLKPNRNKDKDNNNNNNNNNNTTTSDITTQSTSVTTNTNNTDQINSNNTGIYHLWCVLSHKGRSADGGHYVSWIRQSWDENDWILYDDDKVTPVTREDILKLNGALGDWHIAYLCIYRTKN